MKIAIIGMGKVGATIAFNIVMKELCDHLILANRDISKAAGDAMDLQHSLAFCQHSMQVTSSTIADVKESDIVVITASISMSKTMSSRLELGAANITLFKELIPVIANNNPEAVLLVVSNPVDALTYLTTKLSGFASSRVIGLGTLIDSARLRVMLSQIEKIHPDDLRAYVLGEHGPNQFPVFSQAIVGSEAINDNPEHREIFAQVIDAGFKVYHYKGYTNFAIANATCEVIRTIVYDEHRTMPLCTYFDEWLGIMNNCFSIPVVIGRKGILRHLYPVLNEAEQQDLISNADNIKENIRKLLELS
ncbi:MAG: lactate dehydrogenase [Methyloprofundus sp.]|nr:lactate dehydrogenase [Methyloprofundus sp.]